MTGTILFDLDHAARVLRITFIGEVGDRLVIGEVPRYWRAHPEAIRYDRIIDMRNDEGSISWHALDALAGLWRDFAAGRDAGRRTAVIVRDEMQALVARAWSLKFPDGAIDSFSTVVAAHAWLREGTVVPFAPGSSSGVVRRARSADILPFVRSA